MRRKVSWPFIALILLSFAVGAAWGFKLLSSRKEAEDRLDSEGKLRILAPPGIFSKELLREFQRREKVEVELSTESFPASLLRRALKSAPGQYDAALVFHYQVSALRAERKLASLYDTRVKFPISIAPDFRKLPNDRNLMDTAPLMWGLVGLATKKEFEHTKTHILFWPSSLVGLEDSTLQPNAFATKVFPQLGSLEAFENRMKAGLAFSGEPPAGPSVVSHASLVFSPIRDVGLSFTPLRMAGEIAYPMWILTVAALSEGDTERTRKFVKYLLEPTQNIELIQTARVGASTLRDQDEIAGLPESLKASYFRKFPVDQILLERDERVRLADEVLEQMVLGAGAKITKSAEPYVRPTPPIATTVAPANKPDKSHEKKPVPVVEDSGDDVTEPVDSTIVPTSATPAASAEPKEPLED